MSEKTGYTLIELLAVMAIIGILISLGIQGLLMMRSTIEVQETSKQAISMFSLMKNSAKNDVRKSNELNFKGYRYRVDGDNHIDRCTIVGYATSNPWDCVYDVEIENSFIGSNFELNVGVGVDDDPIQGVPKCRAIYFEHLTGDVLVETDSGSTLPSNAKCYIPLTDTSNRFTNYVFFNAIQDSFKVLTTPETVTSEYNKAEESYKLTGPSLVPTSTPKGTTPIPTLPAPSGVKLPTSTGK